MSNKKVFITGATGQDGAWMIDYLLENTDNEIVGCVRRTSQFIKKNLERFLDNPRFRILHLDLNDVHSITSAIRDEKPDYFVNFGAQTFVADSWHSPVNHFMVNAVGVLHILEAIRNHAPECRFYSAGSSEQLGDVEYSPQDEKHPLRARSPYGAAKVAAGQLVKVYRESYGLYAVHGLLFNHESELRQDYFVTQKIANGVARIHHEIKNREEVLTPIELGNLDAKRDWSHARDFVEGIWMMLNQEKYRADLSAHLLTRNVKTSKYWSRLIDEYVLSSNETHSVREFVEKSFAAAGIEGYWAEGDHAEDEKFIKKDTFDTLVKINPKFYRPAEVDLLYGDSSRARKELGWNPKYSFDKLVTTMVECAIANQS